MISRCASSSLLVLLLAACPARDRPVRDVAEGEGERSGEGEGEGEPLAEGEGEGEPLGEGEGEGDACDLASDPLAASALLADVGFLASDALAGRGHGTAGDEAARAFLAARMACVGLLPAGDDGGFEQTFAASDGLITANVVGYLPGSDPERAGEIVVVGAHHDHLGVIDGEIMNGANDNASGSAAVLAIAHALSERPVAPRRTIAFVLFGYEEHEGVCEGSEHFVSAPPPELPLDDVVYMVNADMLGTYPSLELLNVYGSFAGTTGRDVVDARLAEHPAIDADVGEEAGEDDSDFQAFADQGIDTLYFETFDDACYHSACDDTASLDGASYAEIVQLVHDVVLDLADAAADI